MAYNPQRSIKNDMNMTGTGIPKFGGPSNFNSDPYVPVNITQSINSPPQQAVQVSPIRERVQPNALNSSKGYHQFMDDEVLSAINKASEPPLTILSTTDLISAVIYLVWGIVFLVFHVAQDKDLCPFLRICTRNVGLYFIVVAIAKGLGLFAQHHQNTNDTQKQKIRFIMRIGRALELFFLLCSTICLSMALCSPCDTDCGRLIKITIVFLLLSWGFLLTITVLYSMFIYHQFQQQYHLQPFTA